MNQLMSKAEGDGGRVSISPSVSSLLVFARSRSLSLSGNHIYLEEESASHSAHNGDGRVAVEGAPGCAEEYTERARNRSVRRGNEAEKNGHEEIN